MTEGKIFAIESMGLVDGPGIRTVVFFQGCPLRCAFCHNPESREGTGGETVTVPSLMKKILRFRPYFEKSGGGVTLSGGEPLLQKDFLLEFLSALKKEGIHTCLDTSGAAYGDFGEILSLTDLVLYDVKAIDSAGYKKLCCGDISVTEDFLRQLDKSTAKIIVRQVVVPGISDSDEYMTKLSDYIRRKIPRAAAVELLPYHRLGEHKYKKLGIKYPLDGVPAMDKDKTKALWEKHFKAWEEIKND